ncbi:MAG: hypothetical protein PHO26_06480 [Dehalococcoidia bacterium]|nr:hypothetical protein [Dehalococcoidia bacterium]MDD5493423.1 hypothetical protein [Dehalococcoidia bacterium]
MHKGKFGTAINCMDGRTQLPVINWLKEKYSLDFVDMVTEPGPDKILSGGKAEQIESIKSRLLISVNAHGSDTVIVVAHHDCAGNPVSKEEHIRQVKECLKQIRSWKLPLRTVMGVWINEKWSVDEVIE